MAKLAHTAETSIELTFLAMTMELLLRRLLLVCMLAYTHSLGKSEKVGRNASLSFHTPHPS